MAELAKNWDPAGVESALYERWKASGVFRPADGGGQPPYCITIPPPNITGSLHMGHALNHSVIDALIRVHRMRGAPTLCVPGTDHAGISTQNVVERLLASEGTSREAIGREAFTARCREWRDRYGTRIYQQLEMLGCSYDWSRVRYTLDDTYVPAIWEEFRRWYERGLIYRGVRVVNWDVRFQTAISDAEVLSEPRAGHLYHFRYPFEEGGGHITIATTRPETMLGDVAVAANPADERYQPLFGRMLRLPLADRLIPLIADEYAKPEFGSGAVKVTPAHDLNDFECGQRHNLPQVIVIGRDGRMTEEAGARFAGLDRLKAREQVVAAMQELGLVEKIEPYEIQAPISERSGEVIEPLLSEQWFVAMKPLAQRAAETVRAGRIRFVPERCRDMLLDWLDNIRDWCISRQLWWGHRIPVWWTDEAGADGAPGPRHAFAVSREEAVAALGTEAVRQDEDVLDTWFSSALWPHAVLGWPEQTDDLRRFYPTTAMTTAQEILYLWVARMIMTGLDFLDEIPFRDVYVHATVLDERGQRMSKSKGNGVDPVDLIERHGADAVRFALLQQAGRNQDIRFGEQRTEIAGQFCNKLWNASRFVLQNLPGGAPSALPDRAALTVEDRWILSALGRAIEATDAAIADYSMDEAARAIYQFFWNDFCDWYVEMAKPRLREEGQAADTVRGVLAHVLDAVLRLLHPFTPFITETLYGALRPDAGTIMTAPWPAADPAWRDADAERVLALTMEATRCLRNLRAESGIAPATRLRAAAAASGPAADALQATSALIVSLARLESLDIAAALPAEAGWVAMPIEGAELAIAAGGAVDTAAELERIDRELAAVQKEIDRASAMLGNASFVAKASPEKVQLERDRLQGWEAKHAALTARRASFAGG